MHILLQDIPDFDSIPGSFVFNSQPDDGHWIVW